MTALARKLDRGEERARVEAALLRLNPDLDAETLKATLRRIYGTASRELETIEALAAGERKQRNQLIDRMRQLLDEMARFYLIDSTDPRRAPPRGYTFDADGRYGWQDAPPQLTYPGLDAWLEIRRAWRDVASVPEDPAALVKALDAMPKSWRVRLDPNSRRGRGQVKRALANTLAGVYFSLVDEAPKSTDIDAYETAWGELVRTTFEWLGLGAWASAGRQAASDLQAALDKTPKRATKVRRSRRP
jgi:hypothetical protein